MTPAASPENEPDRRKWIGFWSMILQQTQNAFNDKAAQFILVPLAGAVGAKVFGMPVEDAAGIMIALPFVLFAPLAGWLSDRFSKRDVMLGAAIAQLAILVWIFGSVWMRNMPMALLGFFALAVQSAFFGPAKVGINKELVGSRHLGFAAGVQQMMTMLAILVGQIAMGFLFDHRFVSGGGTDDSAWRAAAGPLFVIMLFGIPAIVLALIVPRVPAQGARKLTATTCIEHFTHLRELWSDAPLRLASFGVAFFWGFAAFLNLWSIKIAYTLTRGGEGFGTLQSWFMAAAGLGMAGGFGFASWLLRKRIELGWVPIAGVAMTATAVALALVDPLGSLQLLENGSAAAPRCLFLWTIGLLAFFAALFLAPLNAWMQDRYPADKRGELQSAVNLQDCLAGIIAVACIAIGLKVMHALDPLAAYRNELLIAAGFCGLMTVGIIRLLPSDFIRVVALTLLGTFYRIRGVDARHLPEKGGVFLLPNHVTWADAFFLSAASPRPIRFVMDANYMRHAPIRWFCTLFNTVPIAIGKPREALRVAAEAIAAGDVVCLFPEGQLTRTGTLQPLQRGCELIARQAGAPVVPVWMDGAWGSIFSFERNRFFRKRPYRVPYGIGIAFGAPIDGKDARLDDILRGLLEASRAAVASRLPAWRDKPAITANGYQLGQINALPRRETIARLDSDPEIEALPAFPAFARLFRCRLESHRSPAAAHQSRWVGGDALRAAIEAGAKPVESAVFFDFGSRATEPLEAGGWTHCPCLAVDGVIISMSFPDPPAPPKFDSTAHAQHGRREGTFGPLLPGFAVSEDGRSVCGPATGNHPLALPEGVRVDDEAFVRFA
jgi:acyl-[acyl-carrier-protein]-phospholipid O-acyltransferase/long-chain-fatty-acid--[acyl-carrier-protein] ligase